MQHVSVYGYPTPPASPAFDKPRRCPGQQTITPSQFPLRCVPPAPEARLGMLLDGRLELVSILGTGAYGVVYSAVDIQTGSRYAVKCLSRFNADGTPLDRRQTAFQNREIQLHYRASAHPNVLSMHSIVGHPDCTYVILEYCPEGDLFLNITERGHYVGKDDLSKRAFIQILDAVEHCHRLGIYHRDLKPENILVTDHGDTVKLADFGLATSRETSEDYGCGSTFYMSPECLDHSTRRPFYLSAPNDVWSLGVILVNLTCGRNPWKQASTEDSTYRAYTRNPDFLKSILPLTDELNDILGRIFTRDPEQRITLPELRSRILACSRLTTSAAPTTTSWAAPTPPASAESTEYVQCEDIAIDSYDFHAPPSPASSDSNEGSDCSSDDGSLTSNGSTLDDLDVDFLEERREAPPTPEECKPRLFDPEDPVPAISPVQEEQPCEQHYLGPVPSPIPEPTLPVQVPLPAVPVATDPPRSIPIWKDVVKLVQQPVIQHAGAFHQQIPSFFQLQGCY